MKINGLDRVSGIYKSNQINKNSQVNKSKKKDSLELSSMAKDFRYAKSIGKNIPDVRMDKVEEIKHLMSSNNYNVDGKEVAKKMIESGFDVKI